MWNKSTTIDRLKNTVKIIHCTLYVTVPVSVLKRFCWYGTKLVQKEKMSVVVTVMCLWCGVRICTHYYIMA